MELYAVYFKKKQMKGKLMVIAQSLTRRRLQLLDAAKKLFGFKSVWSFHGNIFAFAAGKKQIISSFSPAAQRSEPSWKLTNFYPYYRLK